MERERGREEGKNKEQRFLHPQFSITTCRWTKKEYRTIELWKLCVTFATYHFYVASSKTSVCEGKERVRQSREGSHLLLSSSVPFYAEADSFSPTRSSPSSWSWSPPPSPISTSRPLLGGRWLHAVLTDELLVGWAPAAAFLARSLTQNSVSSVRPSVRSFLPSFPLLARSLATESPVGNDQIGIYAAATRRKERVVLFIHAHLQPSQRDARSV